MAIQVICPGCHTRFRVSDKHAGKEGACPKCKGTIRVPKRSEEVVVHAPEHSERGTLDAQGRSVLKPIARKDTKFRPLVLVAAVAAVGIVFAAAWMLRGKVNTTDGASDSFMALVLALGAVGLGPPLAWVGYSFLRDPELEAYQGKALLLRSLICGLVYALLWGVFGYVKGRIWVDVAAGESLELYQIGILAIPFLGVGTLAAYASLDLEPMNGFFHYTFYLLFTILLRMTMALPVV
jgi:predicted Zn finger-like uncharacterized protein